MPSRGNVRKTARSKPRTILVFGESQNDTHALNELVLALRADLHSMPSRNPLVLIHREGGGRANIKRNAAQIIQAAKAAQVRWNVVGIVVHKDADDVEPAHESIEYAIIEQIGNNEFECIPAVPAWEIESWWYLWPEAVHAYNAGWALLNRKGKEVGLIRDAKEVLRKELVAGGLRTRTYKESDSIGIARKIRELNVIKTLNAKSNSFDSFSDKVINFDQD